MQIRFASELTSDEYVSQKEALFQISGGKLRKLNLLARHCLFAAPAGKAKSVTDEHVAKARPEVD